MDYGEPAFSAAHVWIFSAGLQEQGGSKPLLKAMFNLLLVELLED